RLDAAKTEALESLDGLVVTARFLAVVLVIGHHHLDAIVRMMGDATFDVITVAVEHALRDGDILLEHRSPLKLLAELAVGEFVLANEDHAAGVSVEPVHNAGAIVAICLAQFGEAEAESINERAAPVALGGVYHHVRRLVDDREVLVLEERVERDVL